MSHRPVGRGLAAVAALLLALVHLSPASGATTTAPRQQAPGQPQALITAAYEGLLGRQPEPAGLQHWVDRIQAGEAPQTVIAALVRSDEHARHVVAEAYRTFLEREPDPTGLAWWTDHLQSTRSLASLRAQLAGSQEYYLTRAGGTNGGFVSAVYSDVLGRVPDQAGLQYWLSQLSAGVSRRQVAHAVLVSNESYLLSDLPVASVSPRPGTSAWELDIDVDVNAVLDGYGSTMLVSVDGQQLAGTVTVENSRISFTPTSPPDWVEFGTTADVIVTVVGYHGGQVDRFDYSFTYRAPVQVSSFTTPLMSGQDRNTNIARAAELIDGTVIEPGETFSLNGAIGERTIERGFVPNGFITGGETVSAVGGGVSQVATTFLNAAWEAGIRLDSFRQHTIYFPRYPMCREATIVWDALDLVVTNDSPHEITIDAFTTPTSLTIRFYSVPWASVDSFTSDPDGELEGGPFRVSCGRQVTYPDGSTSDQEYSWYYTAGFPGSG